MDAADEHVAAKVAAFVVFAADAGFVAVDHGADGLVDGAKGLFEDYFGLGDRTIHGLINGLELFFHGLDPFRCDGVVDLVAKLFGGFVNGGDGGFDGFDQAIAQGLGHAIEGLPGSLKPVIGVVVWFVVVIGIVLGGHNRELRG